MHFHQAPYYMMRTDILTKRFTSCIVKSFRSVDPSFRAPFEFPEFAVRRHSPMKESLFFLRKTPDRFRLKSWNGHARGPNSRIVRSAVRGSLLCRSNTRVKRNVFLDQSKHGKDAARDSKGCCLHQPFAVLVLYHDAL